MLRRTVLLGLALLSSSAAMAADLDYRTVPNERYGSAYEDPRYADLYGRAPQKQEYRAPHGYAHGTPYAYGHKVPVPSEPVYRHGQERYGHDNGRWSDERWGAPRHKQACLNRETIRRELIESGWRDFHDPVVIDDARATVKARRQDSGRLFELKLDRCSGEVITSRPLDGGFGPRVYGDRSYRAY